MEDVELLFTVLPLLTPRLSTCTSLPEIIITISNLLKIIGRYAYLQCLFMYEKGISGEVKLEKTCSVSSLTCINTE
jgi:hypothetical protein